MFIHGAFPSTAMAQMRASWKCLFSLMYILAPKLLEFVVKNLKKTTEFYWFWPLVPYIR